MSVPCEGSLLRIRDFRLYFTARTVSLLGDSMVPVALTVAVVREGYGAGGVGLVLAAPLVPWVAFMLFTGVFADRIGAMPLMIGADALRFVVQAGLGAAFLAGRPGLWLIVSLQVLSGAGTALFQPGVGSVITHITPDVQRANGILRTSEAMVTMLGPAAAGVILAVSDASVVVGADAVTFAVSGGCLLAMRLPRRERQAGGGRVLRDLVEGWREFAGRRWLWVVILVFCVFGLTVFGPFYVLSSAGITERYGSTVLGVILAVEGVGAMAGGLVGGRIRPRRPLFTAVCALTLIIPQFLALAAGFSALLIGAAICVGAAGRAVWAVLWTSTEQNHVPAAALNRVYAYDVTGSLLLLPVGRALTGPIQGFLGFGPALVGCAVVAALGCAAMLAVRDVRRLPARPAVSAGAAPQAPQIPEAPQAAQPVASPAIDSG